MSIRLRRSSQHVDQETFGCIEQLVLQNFKSYAGRHEIGPFDKFTCIIGPNGSGKSNIMDAISFCLGIKTKHLRGDRLKDLVYKREEETADSNTREAAVTLVFRSARGERLHFSRSINSKGEAAYRAGPPEATKELPYGEYAKLLARENIFVKARSFLVFQGDVMNLARRQGTDLTNMLETISGSDQLKDEYTKLSQELELAQEKARLNFQHRREAENIVTLLEQQRAEVQRYHDLRSQRDTLMIETALFKFFCAERGASQNLDIVGGLRDEVVRGETDLKNKKKETDDIDAQKRAIDSDLEQAQQEHFLLGSNLGQCKPEIANCRKQVAHFTIKIREKQVQLQHEEERVTTMDASAKQATVKREEAEKELEKLRGRQVSSAIKMTAAQRKEFDQAKLKTDQLNAKVREKLREAEDKLRHISQEVAASRRDKRDKEEHKNRFVNKLEELKRERIDVEIRNDVEQTEVDALKRQMERIAEEIISFTSFKDSLIEEQQVLRSVVEAGRARHDRLEQLEARQRVADDLRGRFPEAVLGRISELLLPTQKRFDLPLQMSLGAMAEAFVVTDAVAARECVQYLKDSKMSAETFLPLDRMQEPQVGAMQLLTQNNELRRLASMCVKHNDKFLQRHEHWREKGPAAIDRTVNFLLRGVIIADGLDEAKSAAYRDAKKHALKPRVVTLDGEVIAPNGNMSVKSVGAAGLVEFGGAEQLHELRDKERKLHQVDKDLATLEEETSRKQQMESDLRSQLAELDAQRKEAHQQLQELDVAQAAENRHLQKLSEEGEAIGIRIDRGTETLNKLQREKDALEAEMLKVGKVHFKKLNSELKVDDIYEIVLLEQREKARMQSEIEQYEDFLRQLRAEEQRAKQLLASSSKLEAIHRDIKQYQRDIDIAEKRLAETEEKEKNVMERCEAARQRLQDATARKEKFEESTKTLRTEVQRLKVLVDDAKKRLRKQNDKVRSCLETKFQLLRDCTEKQLELPFVEKDDAAIERFLARHRDVDAMSLKELDAACRTIKLDFSNLPADKKDLAEHARARVFDTTTVESEYAAQIAEITKELEGLNPNMHAPDECEVEEAKLREIRQQADEAGRESQRLLRAFEAVKAERVARFMKCFKAVEAKVHPCYKELTSYDGYEGGSAYLDLDDSEEPYKGGITFTACPPGKRFFPMELLSGGERSMASMALLFAMHSYNPPPFMILDEVDAPFDKKNTNSLVSYLRSLNFQTLVISLKDTFFAHSQSIVGIFKDREVQSSGTLSLALQRLGQLAEEPETEVPLAEAISDQFV
eukprot:TRINITY_DN41271_c0_g1_i1.p1 TRINITY_DN41271_c0_g1~~TRINITY_DN41271_c0_g1_i1.p1  ORF type:complete len:1285 (-),score=320.43 TRINITY_DN41271_c0_g1_i1:29-3883(-)